MSTPTDLRPTSIAGRWYPANPRTLAESVDAYIAAAQLPEIRGEIVAVIAPHAGHLYSGPVAGYAFAALKGKTPELVGVVAPMHYPYPQELLTTAHAAYETPLGVIPVERAALRVVDEYLRSKDSDGLSAVSEDPEHALEIELPFLQRALAAPFNLLPVMVRELAPSVLHTLGEALAAALKNRPSLLVASTDLSHFYPQRAAETLDAEMLRRIEAFDPEAVLHAEIEGTGFACGRGAVAAVLWAARELGANKVQILHHATSGDVSGEYTQVVGYAAAVVIRET